MKGESTVSKGKKDCIGTCLEIFKLNKCGPKRENKLGERILMRDLILLLTNAPEKCKCSDLVELNIHEKGKGHNDLIAKTQQFNATRGTMCQKVFKSISDNLESFLFDLLDSIVDNEKGANGDSKVHIIRVNCNGRNFDFFP